MPSRTPAIKGSNSIASLREIPLGGFRQSVLIRGRDSRNPILLFLHGGPGYSQISFAHKYQKTLEEHFVVVNWDQRGSGKSYSSTINRQSMNRDQFVDDTNELIDYLCNTLEKETVYLAGHSWGSELGLHYVAKYPEKVQAFISIGQVVNGLENERISYEFVYDMASRDNNQKALKDLDKIGPPPYQNTVRDISIQRKWLASYGGVERGVNTLHDIILGSVFSPEYTGIDGIRFALGSKFTADTMWGNNLELDFVRDLTEVEVPVYFCAGRFDYNTPSVLIEDYYHQLSAPAKGFFWFEKSAHFPNFEEPEKFAQIVIEIMQKTESQTNDET